MTHDNTSYKSKKDYENDLARKLKFNITVSRKNVEVAKILGEQNVRYSSITLEDLSKVPEVEAFLERLTGFRFHIEEAT